MNVDIIAEIPSNDPNDDGLDIASYILDTDYYPDLINAIEFIVYHTKMGHKIKTERYE